MEHGARNLGPTLGVHEGTRHLQERRQHSGCVVSSCFFYCSMVQWFNVAFFSFFNVVFFNVSMFQCFIFHQYIRRRTRGSALVVHVYKVLATYRRLAVGPGLAVGLAVGCGAKRTTNRGRTRVARGVWDGVASAPVPIPRRAVVGCRSRRIRARPQTGHE